MSVPAIGNAITLPVLVERAGGAARFAWEEFFYAEHHSSIARWSHATIPAEYAGASDRDRGLMRRHGGATGSGCSPRGGAGGPLGPDPADAPPAEKAKGHNENSHGL